MAQNTYGSPMAKNIYGPPMVKNIYGPLMAKNIYSEVDLKMTNLKFLKIETRQQQK